MPRVRAGAYREGEDQGVRPAGPVREARKALEFDGGRPRGGRGAGELLQRPAHHHGQGVLHRDRLPGL